MHSTKSEILSLLKRLDSASVDELTASLGLAAMTVRQHLTALERDDLVRGEEVRRPTGRPHYRFRLTDHGHRRVLEGYDRLLHLIVEEAGTMDARTAGSAEGRRRQLFRAVAAALAEKHRGEVLGLTGEEQVARVAAILRMHGGFAEWRRLGQAFELRDFNCVFRSTIGPGGRCEWHETFLEGVIGGRIEIGPPPEDTCADCCTYIIPARSREPAGHRGTLS